jgi:hypothetical protein
MCAGHSSSKCDIKRASHALHPAWVVRCMSYFWSVHYCMYKKNVWNYHYSSPSKIGIRRIFFFGRTVQLVECDTNSVCLCHVRLKLKLKWWCQLLKICEWQGTRIPSINCWRNGTLLDSNQQTSYIIHMQTVGMVTVCIHISTKGVERC